MTGSSFVFALVLLLLGQIPIVVRLWLDHRERIAPHRKYLYERQVESFQQLYQSLTDSFVSLHHCLTVAPPGLPVEPEHKELVTNIKSRVGPALSKWNETLKQAELLLPADLIRLTSEYDVKWAHLLAVTVGNRTVTSNQLQDEWEALNHCYNAIVNLMRLFIGADALSGQLLDLAKQKRAKLVMAMRKL
jgi:hypothetical protein